MNLSEFYTNKVFWITGGSQGIGLALAGQILANGGKVAISARNPVKLKLLEKVFGEYGDALLIHAGDATDYKDDELMVATIIAHFGKLDGVITNAGISCYGELEKSSMDVAKHVIDTNIYGTMFPIKAAIPELKKTNGSILLVSSVAGFSGLPAYSAYSMSKMSLIALSESLRLELDAYGIFVGIAFPGFTQNHPDKRILNAKGEEEAVPLRPKKLTTNTEDMATNFLEQIKKRRHSGNYTLMGGFTQFLSKFFPQIFYLILKKRYTAS